MTVTPRPPGLSWRPSAILLVVAGVAVAAVGIYFLVLRPPLLPEDVRFIQATEAGLGQLQPYLNAWLSNVFHVLGGQALASGLLAVALAASSYRRREPIAVAAVVGAGFSGIGLMAVTNFLIGSDFRWVILGLASLWVASLVCFVLEALRPTRHPYFTSKGTDT